MIYETINGILSVNYQIMERFLQRLRGVHYFHLQIKHLYIGQCRYKGCLICLFAEETIVRYN